MKFSEWCKQFDDIARSSLSSIEYFLSKEAWEEGARNEREQCAQIAESMGQEFFDKMSHDAAKAIARAIREKV
jgi:hypothetical protein